MDTAGDILALAEDRMLCDLLVKARVDRTQARVCVAMFGNGKSAFAGFDGGSTARQITGTAAPAIDMGCLIKLFTATLAAQAVSAGELRFEDIVGDLVGEELVGRIPQLGRMTFRHLLTHAHGLDGTGLRFVPMHPDGRIDLGVLCASLSETPTLFEPGTYYSYGNAGMWMAAGVLERLLGATYGDLLTQRILQPLGIRLTFDGRVRKLCAATANGARISAEELLRFLCWSLACGEQAPGSPTVPDRALMPGEVRQMPGWGPELGSAVGWKYYGGGWFGHNMRAPQTSACVRLHFESGVALFVACERAPAVVLMARIFGASLPEIRELQMPKPLSDPTEAQRRLEQFSGIYANAALSIRIENHGGRTAIAVLRRALAAEEADARVSGTLRPCTQNVFMTQSARPGNFALLQFMHAGDGRAYLWNGRAIFPRTQTSS